MITIVLGEPNFGLAQSLGKEIRPPVHVQELRRQTNELGQTFVEAAIVNPTPDFWRRLRSAEDNLPPPILPPITDTKGFEPAEDYSQLQTTTDNI